MPLPGLKTAMPSLSEGPAEGIDGSQKTHHERERLIGSPFEREDRIREKLFLGPLTERG